MAGHPELELPQRLGHLVELRVDRRHARPQVGRRGQGCIELRQVRLRGGAIALGLANDGTPQARFGQRGIEPQGLVEVGALEIGMAHRGMHPRTGIDVLGHPGRELASTVQVFERTRVVLRSERCSPATRQRVGVVLRDVLRQRRVPGVVVAWRRASLCEDRSAVPGDVDLALQAGHIDAMGQEVVQPQEQVGASHLGVVDAQDVVGDLLSAYLEGGDPRGP